MRGNMPYISNICKICKCDTLEQGQCTLLFFFESYAVISFSSVACLACPG